MSNIFSEVGHGLKVAAVDVDHAVVEVVDYLPHVAAAVAEAIEAEPELKTVITGLIGQAAAIGPEALATISAKGLNLATDAASVTAIESLLSYFETQFLPVAEKFVGAVVSDLN